MVKRAESKPLNEIQSLMGSFVLNSLNNKQRSQKKLSDGSSAVVLAKSIIAPNKKLTSFQRLEIYNRQYWFRIIDCFYDDFPGLKILLGNNKFYKLSIEYLKTHPSRSYTLRNLGIHLVEFLDKNPKLLGTKFKICLDMARFEWAQIEAFDNERLEPITIDTVAKSSPDNLTLKLQPYIILLELDYALDDFMISLKKERNEGRSEAGSDGLKESDDNSKVNKPKKQKTYIAVHRFNNMVYYKKLCNVSFLLLSNIAAGATLHKACEETLQMLNSKKDVKKLAAEVEGWFKSWVELGWFCI